MSEHSMTDTGATPPEPEPPTGALIITATTDLPTELHGIPRKWYQRWFLDPVRKQLRQGITPDKIALTVALGAGFGLFPMLGVTTALCAIVAAALRLNLPIIQAVNYVLYPVHLVAIFALLRMGEWMFQAPIGKLSFHVLKGKFEESPVRFFQHFAGAFWHAIVCWMILMPFGVALIYYTLRPLLRRYLKRPV